jgi:hypothetical protein
MDLVEVKPVGRFHRIWINGNLLVRNRTVTTPLGMEKRTEPREFMTEEQAWGFLKGKVEACPWLKWKIKEGI